MKFRIKYPLLKLVFCILFIQLINVIPVRAELIEVGESTSKDLCNEPYKILCSSPSVRKSRQEWDLYKNVLAEEAEAFLQSADAKSFDEQIENKQIFFRREVFDKTRLFLTMNFYNLPSKKYSTLQQSKLDEIASLGLDNGRLENKWNASYSPRNSSIDMGYATFVENKKFIPLIVRVAAHEFAHAVDPSAFFLNEDNSNGIFSEKSYPFNFLLKELNAIFPVGYNLTCLERSIAAGKKIPRKFLSEIKKNRYYKDNEMMHLGCGNGYASEAFADYVAHRVLLEGKNALEIQNYVLQQAVHFCSGQDRDITDTHPSDKDRLEKILFKIPEVKKAMGCGI